MLVRIDKKEINAVKYACAFGDLKATFYTVESKEGIVQVDILNQDGTEPSTSTIWYVARQMESKLQLEDFVRR